jgi:hypothetical protein
MQCYGSGLIESGSGFIKSESANPDPAFKRIRTQGFDKQKLKERNTAEKIQKQLFFSDQNCNLLIPRPPKRMSKLQEKPSALKNEIYYLEIPLSMVLFQLTAVFSLYRIKAGEAAGSIRTGKSRGGPSPLNR